MLNVVGGGFLLIHGLITGMIGLVGITKPNAPAMTLPSWFNWWPGPFGRSWLVDSIGLGTVGAVVGGLIWLIAGAALVGAGLGFFGVAFRDQWQLLALVGAAFGLVAAIVYFHPLYLAAVLINVALIWLVWGRTNAVPG